MLAEYISDLLPGETVEDAIGNLFLALRNDLELVSIELEGDDDPQIIFETLNARGEPLLPSDLLRNFVFLRAERAREDVQKLYSTFWLPFDQYFWKKEEGRGRYKRPRIDMFFQYLLQAKTGEEIPAAHLFQEYKGWITDQQPFSTVEDELKELERFAEVFKRLLTPTSAGEHRAFIETLHLLEVKTIYPLVMYLWLDAGLDDSELDRCFRILESYIVRRFIGRMQARSYANFFVLLIRELKKTGPTAANLENLLLSQRSESTLWPDDGMFTQAWMATDAYSAFKPARVESILLAIEHARRSRFNEAIEIKSGLTVEHVMPQQWHKTWPLSDGSYANSQLTRLINKEECPEADARERVVGTFGNLTLLTHSLNASLSNGPYADKRMEIIKQSGLELNRHFNDHETWDEGAIRQRGQMLLAEATRIWARPA